MVANLPLLNAFEAHIINVTAEIKNDIPDIDPPGGEFCNDGELVVELSVTSETLADADIWYTIDGGDPVCHDTDKGFLYNEPFGTGPFPLYDSATVKAVSCHDNLQSVMVSEYFDVAAVYCDPTLKINKVYYDVDSGHGRECHSDNEWIELYNPTANPVNIKNWEICDNHDCDILSSNNLFIPGGGYAVITYKENTWDYWHIPAGAIKIVLNSPIGDGLANAADMLLLKNPQGGTVDQVNWGTPDGGWTNYNSGIWNPGIIGAVRGDIVGRDPNGYDTDHVSDWRIFKLPSVTVTNPMGGEIWYCSYGAYEYFYPIAWEAENPNGNVNDLTIDIVYIVDDSNTGDNYGVIDDEDTRFLAAENLPTGTTGSYDFKVDQSLGYCYTGYAWAKVIATGPENFMINDFGMSGRVYEPMSPEGLSQDTFNNSVSGADGADNPDNPDNVPPVLEADAPASGADETNGGDAGAGLGESGDDSDVSDGAAGGGGSENEEDEELIVAREEDESGADVITGDESEDDDEEESEDNQDGEEAAARDEDESGAVDVDGDGTDDGEGEDEEEITAREEDADMADDNEESDDDSGDEDEPTVARDEEDGGAADDDESDDGADNLDGGDGDDEEEISDGEVSGDVTDDDTTNGGDSNDDGDEEPTSSPSQERNNSGGGDLPIPDDGGLAEIEWSGLTPQV